MKVNERERPVVFYEQFGLLRTLLFRGERETGQLFQMSKYDQPKRPVHNRKDFYRAINANSSVNSLHIPLQRAALYLL
jgi:hypothetical protein